MSTSDRPACSYFFWGGLIRMFLKIWTRESKETKWHQANIFFNSLNFQEFLQSSCPGGWHKITSKVYHKMFSLFVWTKKSINAPVTLKIRSRWLIFWNIRGLHELQLLLWSSDCKSNISWEIQVMFPIEFPLVNYFWTVTQWSKVRVTWFSGSREMFIQGVLWYKNKKCNAMVTTQSQQRATPEISPQFLSQTCCTAVATWVVTVA